MNATFRNAPAMRTLFSFVLLLAAASSGAPAQEPAAIADPTPVIDEILVTGERPGPALWSATRDGKTLWILGMHAPLPAKMTWRSREVESRISESQVVVRWVQLETDIEVNFFAKLAALPAVMAVGDNPKGVKLKDRVTPEAYEQWELLKQKYISHRASAVEKLRPAFAASELRSQAMTETGLSSPEPGAIVWPAVQSVAKKNKVEILEPEVRMSIELEKPREVIGRFRDADLGDAECFANSLARLEADLEVMKTHANAWATGNLEVLRRIPPPDPSLDCEQLLMNLMLNGSLLEQLGTPESAGKAERARLEFERGLKAVNEVWVSTVEAALRDHSSVFALVPLGVLFDTNGPLRTLGERGFVVVEP
ncbi:MAG TPA: TraB/GumN family protein [Steroidobacteraceae bacterium]|nr:TraB/GumN family protein [Steroidobacteraceae bacterium]